jgi:hypothetical protein
VPENIQYGARNFYRSVIKIHGWLPGKEAKDPAPKGFARMPCFGSKTGGHTLFV